VNRLQFAASVVTTVLATLIVSAAAYSGATGHFRPTAVVAHPTPTPISSPEPPEPVIPSPAPAGLFAIDQDMISASTGWMLLSDCPPHASDACHYAAAGTVDGGSNWTSLVQVGPSFSPSDGSAPRAIRFLNYKDGFVYGAGGAYVTHDGGSSWHGAGLPTGFVSSIAISPTTVWAIYYPCAKGTMCAYEVRSSTDAGKTWSAAHKLPLNFSPGPTVAFGSGVILSSVPSGDIEMTSDGITWRDIKSPCSGNPFRGYATTADGSELWELCLGYPTPTGEVASRSLMVSEDGGKSWSARPATQLVGSLSAWFVSGAPHVALAAGDHATLVTHDAGKSWVPVSPAGLELSKVFVLTPHRGWAIDSTRNVWESADGGDHWNQVGALPSTLS
jgi:hypothetical protein